MRKFIIVGKTTGAVMLYDADYGGMAVATYYTVRQLISMGATVIGMKANTKQFSCYVMDKNENRSLGAGVPVVGTKRSASTFMKGIKDPAKKQAEKERKKQEKKKKTVRTNPVKELINEIEERLTNRYKVLEGDSDTIYVKDQQTGQHFAIKAELLED